VLANIQQSELLCILLVVATRSSSQPHSKEALFESTFFKGK